MNKRKIWLCMVLLIISVCVFNQPIKAEEANEKDSAVLLPVNQTITRSVDGKSELRHSYKIELSEKSAITIYGNFNVESYTNREIDIEIRDVNGKSISHKLQSLYANGDYRWRTDEIEPGTYYIMLTPSNSINPDGLVSYYGMIGYSIAYSLEPYPVSAELAENKEIKCKVGINVFKINVSSQTDLTVYGGEGIAGSVRVKFADINGKEISSQFQKTNQADYKAVVKGLLPGIYYIETIGYSSESDYSYSVLYSTDPYPESILLERGKGTAGSLHPGFSSKIYKINIDAKQKIKCTGSKRNSDEISLKLYDSKSECIAQGEQANEEDFFEWYPDQELMPGTYYLEVSAGHASYNIMWQTMGLSKIKDLKITKVTDDTIEISWSASPGASKYKIYNYNKKNRMFNSLYRTTTSKSYKIKGLKVATTYSIKIVPVEDNNGEFIEGEAIHFDVATKPAKVSVKKIKKTKSGKVSGKPVAYYKISWKKVENASGYQVFVKTKGCKWKMVNATSSRSCKIYVDKGCTAKIKVRAYITTKDATTYGSFSKIKNIKSNVK